MMNLKLIILTLYFSAILLNNSLSIENKIITKVNNKIITNVDIEQEAIYLSMLNKNLDKLDKKKIFEVSKNSLIKQKIKEIEISKFTNKMILKDEQFEKFIETNLLQFGYNNKDQFLSEIKRLNIDLENFKKKIFIETIWSQIIFNKFSTKIKINKKNIENLIIEEQQSNKSYLLYEIVFNIKDLDKQKERLNLIKQSIKDYGFENTASIYSDSETSKFGGKIGWIDENSLNPNIKKEILTLNVGDYSNPILFSGGYLILKVSDIKENFKEINFEEEFKKILRIKTNEQLNLYSNLYFEKIKKDILINEL